MKTKPWSVAIACLMNCISLSAAHSIAAQPDLTGKWSRLGGVSDNPWEKIQISLGKSVVDGNKESGGAFNKSSLVHRSPDKDALRRRLLRFAGLLDRIDLEQKRTELRVSFRGVYRESYRLDGKPRNPEKHARDIRRDADRCPHS